MKKYLISVVVLGFALLFSGCRTDSGPSGELEGSPAPNLQISYKVDQERCTTFPEEDFGDAFRGTLEYFKVKDVMVSVGNTSMPLEDALRDGTITFHEIHYLAQKDAASGICYETVNSKRGLTRFSYDYLSYKLIITNDIYETPDGQQHHIRDLTVTHTGSDPMLLLQHLDQEDWGIQFEVADVTPSGITLNYTQSGGQLIGQLRTGDYQLSRTDIVKAIFPLDDTPAEPVMIQHNTESSMTLDFEQRFGVLDSGAYLLYLYLHDDYDPEQVPSLIRNYHDIQCYGIEFSIP